MTLRNSVVSGLEFFTVLEPEILDEFCKVALCLLQEGVNPKVFANGASKLNTSVDEVKTAVEALAFTLLHGIKLKFSAQQFEDFLSGLSLSKQLHSSISNTYQQCGPADMKISWTPRPFNSLPTYKSFHWRFDIEVASRVCLQQVKPIVLLNFEFDNHQNSASTSYVVLQCDPKTLLHILKELETALGAIKTRDFAKLSRTVCKYV